MTAARDDWLRARERKRAAVAWSAALGFYALLVALALLVSLFRMEELSDFSGPIVVRLGVPEGSDAPKPVPETPPVPAAPAPPAVPETPTPAPAVPPKPTPAATPVKPETAPPQPAVPAAPVPQAQPAPPAPAPVVLRGSESGNSYDMTLLSGTGVVGRSFYVPIWLFLPVPNEVPASIYDAIPDEMGLAGTAEARRKLFATFYIFEGGRWRLKGSFRQPDYEHRKSIWIMLEDAGFDVKNADYKKDKVVKPVVVLFKVSAPGPTGKPSLEAVHIESSSGYSNIDDDVLYGFKKAEFSNSGSTSISGRFTYRF